jgi:hypothetical protein
MAGSILYFSYGHNTNIPELKHRIPNAKRIGVAVAPNQQLEINHYTNIIARDGSKTYGVLWAVDMDSLKVLDWYEGDGKDYSHAFIEVLYKGELYKALTYVMIKTKDDINRSPSHKYLKHVYDGYRMNGIPADQLSIAVRNRQNNY